MEESKCGECCSRWFLNDPIKKEIIQKDFRVCHSMSEKYGMTIMVRASNGAGCNDYIKLSER